MLQTKMPTEGGKATCRIWRILYVAVDKENKKNHGDNMT